ncbi:hypothetical protein LX36DRAFT_419031 [Colletotrichum falcatum]|nr:hypothetical protein LX36DRAFT_419031 [Colletotrichum falcatum]
MNQGNTAPQDEELSDWEHCRRLYLEHSVEEEFFIRGALLRRGDAETLLDDFDRGALTREQLARYVGLSGKLEDSLLRRAARLGRVVRDTTLAWLMRKRDLADGDYNAVATDPRARGFVGIVYALEGALARVVLASRDPKLREAHEALGVGRPDWERLYHLPVEEWRTKIEAEANKMAEEWDREMETRRRHRGV